MNFEIFNLNVNFPPILLKESISALLHTILFHRAFGEVTPRLVSFKLIDASYVCCDDMTTIKLVDDNVLDIIYIYLYIHIDSN